MADNKGILLPAYVMADESYSMKPNELALAEGMVSLHESLRSEPMIAAKVRLAVLGFSKDVAVDGCRSRTSAPRCGCRS